MKPDDFVPSESKAVRRIYRGRLFWKYFALILGLVCGVLLVSGGISVYFSYQENKSALASLQHEKAVAAASRIEQFVKQIEQQLGFAALPQLGAEGVEQRRIEFLKLLRQVPAVTDITQIDSKGQEVLSVSRLAMDVAGSSKDRSKDPAFLGAKPGQTWFGPVYFRKETEPYMAIALRSGGANGSVTVAEVNLKFIWDVVTRIKIGVKGKAYVVDGTGHLVADPDIGLVLRKTDYSKLGHVRAALEGPPSEEEKARLAYDLAGKEVLTAYASVDPLGWKVFVEQPVSEVYATLNATIMRTGMLMVAGLLFSALTALWLARGLVRPIRTLQEGAQRIGEGELDQKIEIKTGDELEALADQFNRMTDQLRESYAGLERKVDERTSELTETLGQQMATAEILRVISSSPTDTQPAFEAIAANSARLIGEDSRASVWITKDGKYWPVAFSHPDAQSETAEAMFPAPLDAGTVVGSILANPVTTQIPDIFQTSFEGGKRIAKLRGWHAFLGVPLVREGVAVGAIGVSRARVGGFTDKQVSLLETFASQAVIAIENVRLFNETKESLEQQTATAEVLKAISRSTLDLDSVLQTLIDNATRLCNADNGVILRPNAEGGFEPSVAHGYSPGSPVIEEMHRHPLMPGPGSATGRALLEKRAVHIHDVLEEPGYERKDTARLGHFRTLLAVPMLRGDEPIGVISMSHGDKVEPFTDKQIELVTTFADQAVIAIENVRLFKEIQEKSRQLEIAGKHKSEFLANMSHELRTPLNAIIGFSEVLIEKMFGELNEKQDDYLKDIHSSGKHLLSLINDILDLSKIEAGRMDLEPSSFDVPNALANALTLIRERAMRHSIDLSLEVDPSFGEIRADERKVKQILLNLLSNAVKFTPDGGKVQVKAHREGDALQVAVIDTGIGIAAADQAAVFEEFRQVGRHYTNKNEGTGLGLALTKRFVELHGGRLWLESEPGKGSTFTFTIPGQQ